MYTCYRCGYHSDYKKNLARHLSRKKICPHIFEDITIEDVKIRNGIEFSTPKNSNSLQTTSVSLQITPKNSNNLFKCEYCNSEFNRKDNLTKHIKRSCKEKNRQDKKIQEEVSLLKEELKRKEEESKKREEE